MINIYKNVIRYQTEDGLHFVNKYVNRDFLANGVDLIDRQET